MIDNFDESENFEVLFFGSSNLTLTIGGNHFLFNINNWNSSLEQFRKGFEKIIFSKILKIWKRGEFIKKGW